ILNEILVRERLGECPRLEEYCRRFPPHAEKLKAQLELHRLLSGQRHTPGVDPSVSTVVTPLEGHSPPAARTAGAPRLLPDQFGRYRIVKILGRGGMGTVYLAHDAQLDRPVALKVPHFSAGNEAGPIARFYREARMAATFVHPNLCPVHD